MVTCFYNSTEIVSASSLSFFLYYSYSTEEAIAKEFVEIETQKKEPWLLERCYLLIQQIEK